MQAKFLMGLIATAVAAGLASAAPLLAIVVPNLDVELRPAIALNFVGLALILNFLIGLPTAITAFWLVNRNGVATLARSFLLANLAGLFVAFVATIFGGLFGLFFYGIPVMIAANVWAFFGWHWAAKPLFIAARDA